MFEPWQWCLLISGLLCLFYWLFEPAVGYSEEFEGYGIEFRIRGFLNPLFEWLMKRLGFEIIEDKEKQ